MLDASGPEWQALQQGLGVRDRLMHPKLAGDLTVSDNEIRTTMQGFQWINVQLLALLLAALGAHPA